MYWTCTRREYDTERPLVCFDETSKQLIAHTRAPIEAEPGRLERIDYEYRRNGTRNLFVFCEPKGGMEARGGHGATHCCGLCRADEVAGGSSVSRR